MTTEPTERIAISRVWLAGGAAFVISVLANVIVRIVVVAFFPISPLFLALETWQPIVVFTLIGVFGATVVFAILARLTARAIIIYRWLAGVLLLVSFIPNILMLIVDAPGATIPAVISLMVMHVLTAAITVSLLTTWPRVRL